MRVRTSLLPAGVHQAPQGTLYATPERLKAMARRFRLMKALGLKVPVCWHHQLDAVPLTGAEIEARNVELARLNAGYLESMEYDPGRNELVVEADLPPVDEVDPGGNLITLAELPDGRKVKTAIQEVSAGIRDWRDGQDRLWKDAIIHVALVPRPVVGGQRGFTRAADAGGTVYLSTATWRAADPSDGGEAMAAQHPGRKESIPGKGKPQAPPAVATPPPAPAVTLATEDDDEDDWDEAGEGDKGEKEPPGEGETPSPEPKEPTPAEIAKEAAGGDDEVVHRVIEELAKMGVILDPDTDKTNFWERISAAIQTANHHREQMEAERAGREAEAPDSTADATEAARPMLMSLATATDPLQKTLLRREQDRVRGELTARAGRALRKVEALARRGMPAARATAFRNLLEGPKASFAGYTLALTDAGEAVKTPAERQLARVEHDLAVWNEALPGARFTEAYLATEATEAERPGKADEVSQEEIQARAAAVSRA